MSMDDLRNAKNMDEFKRQAQGRLTAMREELMRLGFLEPNGETLSDRGRLATAVLSSLIPTEDLAGIAILAAVKRGEVR